jgi:uncharacterized protein DUF1801
MLEETDQSVDEFLASVQHPVRRRDARTLRELMTRVTGMPARMWGSSIVGFGRYQYKYASGREGEAGATGFSPRKAASVVYLPDGVGAHIALLKQLGPHKTGVVCVYLKDLAEIDLAVLEKVIRRSYASVSAGTYTKRASASA